MTALLELMRAETPQERKVLRLVRTMTPAQKLAALALLKAMAAFKAAMNADTGGKP